MNQTSPRCSTSKRCSRAACMRCLLCVVGVFGIAGPLRAGWVVEPVHTTANAGWSVFLDLDPSGRPYASYFTVSGAYPIAQRTANGWQETQTIPNGLAFAL